MENIAYDFDREVFPRLTTQRLDLVALDSSHAQPVYELFSDPRVVRYYNLLPMATLYEAIALVEKIQSRYEAKLGLRWAISLRDEGKVVGTIGYNHYAINHRANIGYDLKYQYWNRGLMSEALRAVISFGFERLLINRIEGEVMQGNVASNRLLEKLGFIREGVLRQWLYWEGIYFDMSMYALLRSEYDGTLK